MSFSGRIDEALQSRIFDFVCAPVTCLPAWASDGALLRLMATWALTCLAAWALTHATRHRMPPPAAFRRALADGARWVGEVADPLLTRGSQRWAAWWAAWLSVHGLPRTAARVRAINGLSPA